ncbi:PhnD/SsuA/transferrin family substrate-binding protein [Jannaschia pohangensis]|uniref:ABC-type phosphate/phosphonate transport system, substrate-binding protein n=1 Tax=Jannaschia pohangensis TaxID=390807 RepID=A0A1I3N8E5_9RHOB|nr:PhnD/SsuA/transferrin family substrate-binding protein [Jannaschia pohangensis]SFJ05300.1 hypothetical protein SAMN04488095_2075 [Jannaschia pohangensis]
MIASLAWYPAARPAWEALWQDIRRHLGEGPEVLHWPEDFARHWRSRDLLLSMTCALPMKLGLADHVHVVGAPVWDVPGLPLPRGTYASHFVTRVDDRRPLARAAEGGLAVNAGDSQSGWGTLVAAGLEGPRIVTGSHAASMRAVAEGRADLAAIDVVTWALAPHPGLRIRVTTPPTPSTPFITAFPEMVPRLEDALRRAIAGQNRANALATRLSGLVQMPVDAYAVSYRKTA